MRVRGCPSAGGWYRYIAVRTKQAVNPSDEVDQAWHLHLLYSRSYQEDFCADVLKTPFRQGPPPTERFGEAATYRRINTMRHWMIRIPRILLAFDPMIERWTGKSIPATAAATIAAAIAIAAEEETARTPRPASLLVVLLLIRDAR